jgi:hypothetical protein
MKTQQQRAAVDEEDDVDDAPMPTGIKTSVRKVSCIPARSALKYH